MSSDINFVTFMMSSDINFVTFMMSSDSNFGTSMMSIDIHFVAFMMISDFCLFDIPIDLVSPGMLQYMPSAVARICFLLLAVSELLF